MSSGFSKLSVLPFEFAKTSLCTTLSHSHSRLQTCNFAVSGTKNDQGTLEASQSPFTNALSCLSTVRKFFVNSLGPTASMSSTRTPPRMFSPVFANRQITLILNEAMFFECAREMFLPASRRCLETQHGFMHSPHHTSTIRQNLRVPAFRWLCVQLFAFTDVSVEKSLCVVCQKKKKASCP